MKGITGKILRIDLTSGRISVDEPGEAFYRQYLGGAGIVSYYLLKEIPAGINPFSPENKLIFAMGPLTGLPLAGATRDCVGAKSPLTGGYAKSESGGVWPMEFKRTGYDGLIVEGKAEHPVYVWIDAEGKVEIRDATRLWGKNVQETQAAIAEELGEPRARTTTIGPAGENLVKYACIMSDLKDAHGRGGMGAVMGSKNLKAITVRGTQMPETADPETIKERAKWFAKNLRDIPIFNRGFSDFGTGATMEAFNQVGNLPSYNFDGGFFDDTDKISPVAMANSIRIGMEGCAACAVRCKRVVEFGEPYRVTAELGAPEYETLGTLGSCCGIGDLKAICRGNQLCNLYGLDTITAGMTIAFAMECFANGILTLEDTGGLDLSWGNADAMLELLGMIARREGIGDLLAEGTRLAAQRLGHGSEEFAMQVKGLEMPMHDPRLKNGMGIIYAVSPTGADHNIGPHDTAFTMENAAINHLRGMGALGPVPAQDLSATKVINTKAAHLWYLFCDSALACIFVPWTIHNLVDLIRASTGWEYTVYEAMLLGERVATMARIFNLREGFTAADDQLPKRMFSGTRMGALQNSGLDAAKMDAAIKQFYALMGWDSDGVPTQVTLEELGLEWAVECLPAQRAEAALSARSGHGARSGGISGCVQERSSVVKGVTGKILRIDLTSGRISVDEPEEAFYRRYLGGAGIVSYYLLKEIPAGIDPLSPENKLIFAMGPLTGLALAGATRDCVGAKSPLTGSIAKSESGGVWPMEFKRTGYDGLIVEGRAERPVYIWIDAEGKVEIRDATLLWGKNVQETQAAIVAELGEPRARTTAIGPAGENLVKYACIMSDLKDAHGRGGMGAVMGSKNLKAITVRGTRMVETADPETIKEKAKWFAKNLQEIPIFNKGYSALGTGATMEAFNQVGNLPSYNFDGGFFEDTDKISPTAMANSIRIGMEGCAACAVRCKRVIQFEEPYPVTAELGAPEYETLGTLGSCLGISDLKAVCRGNQLCNLYGLDTITAGMTIAFAMECFANGILTLEDTGGIDLSWGNGDAMLELLGLIARREGIGDLLAEGSKVAAQRLGHGSEEFAMQVKGLEMPMHDPRLKNGMGIIYAVSPTGADHNVGPHDTAFTMENAAIKHLRGMGALGPVPAQDLSATKVINTKAAHLWFLFCDCALACIFVPWTIQNLVDLVRASTGWEYTVYEAMLQGERVATMARIFNLREGFTAADDQLPKRMFKGTRMGALQNSGLDAEKMDAAVKQFYALMGWDSDGVPTLGKLEELGIEWLAEYLPKSDSAGAAK